MSAEAALTFLLQNVKDLLASNKGFIAGAETELKLLQDELDNLRHFLQESAQIHKEEDQFNELQLQIRDVVYDVEDVIDTCLTKVAVKTRNPFRKLSMKTTTHDDLAVKVKELRENKVRSMIDEATRKFARIKISDAPAHDAADSWSTTVITLLFTFFNASIFFSGFLYFFFVRFNRSKQYTSKKN